jgi:hypothetical protein
MDTTSCSTPLLELPVYECASGSEDAVTLREFKKLLSISVRSIIDRDHLIG